MLLPSSLSSNDSSLALTVIELLKLDVFIFVAASERDETRCWEKKRMRVMSRKSSQKVSDVSCRMQNFLPKGG